MSTEAVSDPAANGLAARTWRLDPARSSVEFHVPHLCGPMTVEGRFERAAGVLDVAIEAAR